MINHLLSSRLPFCKMTSDHWICLRNHHQKSRKLFKFVVNCVPAEFYSCVCCSDGQIRAPYMTALELSFLMCFDVVNKNNKRHYVLCLLDNYCPLWHETTRRIAGPLCAVNPHTKGSRSRSLVMALISVWFVWTNSRVACEIGHHNAQNFNSLWHCNAIKRHRLRSTLGQVMARWLTTSRH